MRGGGRAGGAAEGCGACVCERAHACAHLLTPPVSLHLFQSDVVDTRDKLESSAREVERLKGELRTATAAVESLKTGGWLACGGVWWWGGRGGLRTATAARPLLGCVRVRGGGRGLRAAHPYCPPPHTHTNTHLTPPTPAHTHTEVERQAISPPLTHTPTHLFPMRVLQRWQSWSARPPPPSQRWHWSSRPPPPRAQRVREGGGRARAQPLWDACVGLRCGAAGSGCPGGGGQPLHALSGGWVGVATSAHTHTSASPPSQAWPCAASWPTCRASCPP